MSWVLTRVWGNNIPVPAYCLHLFQMYRDEDIYGRGKWEGDNCPWWHLPVIYRHRWEAVIVLNREIEKDPSWEYSIDYYE